MTTPGFCFAVAVLITVQATVLEAAVTGKFVCKSNTGDAQCEYCSHAGSCDSDLTPFDTQEECETQTVCQIPSSIPVVTGSWVCNSNDGDPCIFCSQKGDCDEDLTPFNTKLECERLTVCDSVPSSIPVVTGSWVCNSNDGDPCIFCSQKGDCDEDLTPFNTKLECERLTVCDSVPSSIPVVTGSWVCNSNDGDPCIFCSQKGDCDEDLTPFATKLECERLTASSSCDSADRRKDRYQCGSGRFCTRCRGIDCVPGLKAYTSHQDCIDETSCMSENDAGPTLYQCAGGGQCRPCKGSCIPDLAAHESEQECIKETKCTAAKDNALLYQCADTSECRTCKGVDDCIPDLRTYDSAAECATSTTCTKISKTAVPARTSPVHELPSIGFQCAGGEEKCQICTDNCIPDLAKYDSEAECASSTSCEATSKGPLSYQCDGGGQCKPCSRAEFSCIPDMAAYETIDECIAETTCQATWVCTTNGDGPCRLCESEEECKDLTPFKNKAVCEAKTVCLKTVPARTSPAHELPSIGFQCAGGEKEKCQICTDNCIPDLAKYDSEAECASSTSCEATSKGPLSYQCDGGGQCKPCSRAEFSCIPDMAAYETIDECIAETTCQATWVCTTNGDGPCRLCESEEECKDLTPFKNKAVCEAKTVCLKTVPARTSPVQILPRLGFQCTGDGEVCQICGSNCIPDLAKYDTEAECSSDTACEPAKWVCPPNGDGGCRPCLNKEECKDLTQFTNKEDCESKTVCKTVPDRTSPVQVLPRLGFQCTGDGEVCQICGSNCISDLAKYDTEAECASDTACEPAKWVCPPNGDTGCRPCQNKEECKDLTQFTNKADCESKTVCKNANAAPVFYQCDRQNQLCRECTDNCRDGLAGYRTLNQCKANC